MILDTNGNGKRDAYVEPNQPVDPAKDKRIDAGFYAVMPNPSTDRSGAYRATPAPSCASHRGRTRPKRACRDLQRPPPGFGPRGARHRQQGSSGSRSPAAISALRSPQVQGPLNGPKATGDHCPEAGAFYQYPGRLRRHRDNSAESSYYSWVDQHNTLRTGEDVPMSTGNLNDGLIAYQGRPDGDAARAVSAWLLRERASTAASTIRSRMEGARAVGCERRSGAVAHETGKGTRPFAAHFQVRPNPLAK
jgi:hypothetical protein